MNDQADLREQEDAPLTQALRALPQMTPPAALSRQIDALVATAAAPTRPVRHWPPAGWLALAASAAFAVWVALPTWAPRGELPATAGPATATVEPAADRGPSLDVLMARSAYLESVLEAVPRRGRVQRVGTASTITAIEDRVAFIDAQLSEPGLAADGTGRVALWRERVGLMDTLVSLHAQPATIVAL